MQNDENDEFRAFEEQEEKRNRFNKAFKEGAAHILKSIKSVPANLTKDTRDEARINNLNASWDKTRENVTIKHKDTEAPIVYAGKAAANGVIKSGTYAAQAAQWAALSMWFDKKDRELLASDEVSITDKTMIVAKTMAEDAEKYSKIFDYLCAVQDRHEDFFEIFDKAYKAEKERLEAIEKGKAADEEMENLFQKYSDKDSKKNVKKDPVLSNEEKKKISMNPLNALVNDVTEKDVFDAKKKAFTAEGQKFSAELSLKKPNLDPKKDTNTPPGLESAEIETNQPKLGQLPSPTLRRSASMPNLTTKEESK